MTRLERVLKSQHDACVAYMAHLDKAIHSKPQTPPVPARLDLFTWDDVLAVQELQRRATLHSYTHWLLTELVKQLAEMAEKTKGK